jgi:hypothetical protein
MTGTGQYRVWITTELSESFLDELLFPPFLLVAYGLFINKNNLYHKRN